VRRYPWLVVSILALVGVLLLGAFPARAYLDQVHERQELAARVRSLSASNDRLVQQAVQLRSDATIEQLARERYQLVRPGEEAYAILPDDRPAVAAPARNPVAASRSAASWWARAWARVTSIF
jgi:cell division protein FtsB